MFEFLFPIFCFGVVITGIVVKGLLMAADMNRVQSTRDTAASETERILNVLAFSTPESAAPITAQNRESTAVRGRTSPPEPFLD